MAMQQVANSEIPEEGDMGSCQAAWERRELARAESDGSLSWLNSSTLWSLHSALDALVEQQAPTVVTLVTRIHVHELNKRLAAEAPQLAAQLPEGALEAIAKAAGEVAAEDFKYQRPKGNGSERWEVALRPVGLGAPPDRPIPEAMDIALTEACVLRDVLSHRGGRIDQKAARDWPSGTLTVGSFVRISQAQVKRYSAAFSAYGSEVTRRLLARFGVEYPLDLDKWADHAFLV